MKSDCCCPPANATACGCCEGVEPLTPLSTENRPGLSALSYRIGTHAAFLETMKARLSSNDYPKLAALTTREADDFSIALLDAWAVVADVLTFYQERIANEGYLRTATERRSVLELARLVGYQPRPGVASSVYLAYTLDANFKEETTIAKGSRSQSVPGPGELPQSFETSEDLKARAKWNNLKPRMTQPQREQSVKAGDGTNQRIYLKGIATNLKPNDPLLIDFGSGTPDFHRVKDVKPDAQTDRTLVILQEPATQGFDQFVARGVDLIGALTLPPSVQLANSLQLERDLKVVFRGSGVESGKSGESSLRKTLAGGEASHAALKAFAPVLRETLATATANAEVTPESGIKVYALRLTAPLFGGNAPKKPDKLNETTKVLGTKEWELTDIEESEEIVTKASKEQYSATVFLDAGYDKVLPDTWIVVDTSAVVFDKNKTHTVKPAEQPHIVAKVKNPHANGARAVYGISGKTTRIELIDPQDSSKQKEWFVIPPPPVIGIAAATTGQPLFDDFQIIRRTVVYAQSEELELAEEPIDETVCGGTDELLELDGLYEGLESGRWVVVSGERDIPGTSGVRFSELAMLASATQNVGTQVKRAQDGNSHSAAKAREFQVFPGDKTRTFIQLAEKLAYCFKRDTITIYGNVIKATHGETRKEVLGSGDGAKTLQSFVLKQPPLTYVSASNPAGVDSTLKVFVNDVQWKETDALAGLSSTDRKFITKTDDDSKTTVVFGNGHEGARLPTGIENIKAEYRNGIGKSGNVKAGQITLLSTRPLGVKEVINPLRATGGADKESRDQARKNAPLAVKALDRLVSVQDYEDFTCIYAGIGKARAVELSDGRRQLVHITIAGADDIPIDKNSDLYRNLRQSLLDFGDPHQAVQLEIRELMLIVISARIRVLPEYQWEPVVTQVRATLLEAFGFERRELGQDVLLSEVISVMQAVRGVEYVDVDLLRGIPEKTPGKQSSGNRRLLTPSEIADWVSGSLKDQNGNEIKGVTEPLSRLTVNLASCVEGGILPAQLAFLTPDVPEALILNQIT
ncbi:MAG: hypothetical protein OJF50_005811 [Nitrospira sp.]|nr:hypothetical protein [Nitrospira sp.]